MFIVYSKENCSQCDQAIMYLKLKGVDQKNIAAFEVVGVALNAVFNIAADEEIHLVEVVLMYGYTLKFSIGVMKYLKFIA